MDYPLVDRISRREQEQREQRGDGGRGDGAEQAGRGGDQEAGLAHHHLADVGFARAAVGDPVDALAGFLDGRQRRPEGAQLPLDFPPDLGRALQPRRQRRAHGIGSDSDRAGEKQDKRR